MPQSQDPAQDLVAAHLQSSLEAGKLPLVSVDMDDNYCLSAKLSPSGKGCAPVAAPGW